MEEFGSKWTRTFTAAVTLASSRASARHRNIAYIRLSRGDAEAEEDTPPVILSEAKDLLS
jgi:hypothetical protein